MHYPVLENWLIATCSHHPFIKQWLDEVIYALTLGSKAYIKQIKQYSNATDILQRIGNPEYLAAYVACQKVMHEYQPNLCVLDCDQNALFYQVRCGWVKEKVLIDLALNQPTLPYPKIIKLAHKERKFLLKYYERRNYFKNSLLDI